MQENEQDQVYDPKSTLGIIQNNTISLELTTKLNIEYLESQSAEYV